MTRIYSRLLCHLSYQEHVHVRFCKNVFQVYSSGMQETDDPDGQDMAQPRGLEQTHGALRAELSRLEAARAVLQITGKRPHKVPKPASGDVLSSVATRASSLALAALRRALRALSGTKGVDLAGELGFVVTASTKGEFSGSDRSFLRFEATRCDPMSRSDTKAILPPGSSADSTLPLHFVCRLRVREGVRASDAAKELDAFLGSRASAGGWAGCTAEFLRSRRVEGKGQEVSVWITPPCDKKEDRGSYNAAALKCREVLRECSAAVEFAHNIAGSLGRKPAMTPLVALLAAKFSLRVRAARGLATVLGAMGLGDKAAAALVALDGASVELSLGDVSELLEAKDIPALSKRMSAAVKMAVMQARQPALVVANLLKVMGPAMLGALQPETRQVIKLFKKCFDRVDAFQLILDAGIKLDVTQNGLLDAALIPDTVATG